MRERLNPFGRAGMLAPEEEKEELSPSPVQAPVQPTEVPKRSRLDPFGKSKMEAPQQNTYYSNKGIIGDAKKMESIRNYMMHRKGDYYRDLPDEEVFDDFVDHMRWMETNEVSTLGEARQVFDLRDEEKYLYSDAYGIYDSLGNAMQAGGLEEVADAAQHYIGAAATAPSTWIGGMFGRAAAKPVTKGVTKALQVALGKKLAEEVAEKGVKEGIKTTAKLLEKKATKKIGPIAAKKSRKELVTAALIGAGADGGLAYRQNLLLQDTRIEAGAQDVRDYREAGLNAAFGLLGGGVAYLPDALRGTVKLTDADQKIKLAKKLRAKEARKKIGDKVESSIKKLASDWEELAKEGQAADAKKYIREKSIDWFFDINDENSFIRILHSLGADLGEDNKNFSHQVLEYARGIPPAKRASITKALKPFGITFGDMTEIFAGAMKEGGESLSKASQASRFFEDFKNVVVTKKKAIDETVEGEKELANATKEAPSPEVLRYTASVWKRMLVSSPATTMLNIKGWGAAAAARAMSEILHGGVLGSVGVVQKLMGMKAADRSLAKSSALFKSNGLLIRSLLDPFTTVQGFTELLENAPAKHRKESLSSFFGGVGDERPELFKINPDNKFVKGVEKTVDVAADLALVRAQDIFTKSFSGLKELDKLSRIELGKGVEELLQKGETHLITDDMWHKAVNTLLEDTFSVNYTRGHSVFNKMAKMIESISNTPGFGFIFPFGRFVNNTMGFAYQYSPLAFMPLTKYQKGLDLEERLAKATVGTAALAMLTYREEQKQKEGLQWNEERTSTGDIKDVQGLYPLSLYNLMGRIITNINNGSGIPLHLKDELIKQVGPLGTLDDLTSSNPIIDMTRALSKTAEGEGGTDWQQVAGIIGEMLAGSVANVVAGFTRPLDTPNDVLGAALDLNDTVDDRAIDRKQAQGTDAVLQNFGRYTNTFFNLLLGKDEGNGKLFGAPKNSATERDSIKDPNPVSRTLGSPLKPRQDSIDILLGMVDMAPFKADSFTSGVPEYDDFINNSVFPILERKAQALLDSDFFKERPLSIKRVMVTDLIEEARKEVLTALENGALGDAEDVLYNKRREFVASNPQSYRAEAKKYFGITTDDRELTEEELSKLQAWIDINKELDETAVETK